MATVSAAAITRITDLEGSPSITSIGGGAGASANTDVFLQASQSVGRRSSNATDKGFWITTGTQDLSAAGVHLGAWVWITHYGVITALKIRAGAGQTNYDDHTVPIAGYPKLGGWYRVWLDISRTPEAAGGSGANEAALTDWALTISIPTVGGTSDNEILDALDFTITGLSLTGTSGLWSDFTTADENATNQYGVARTVGGIINCLARLTLGTASSLVFDDSNFVIVFPNQALVATDFMGITCDLQHASTDISWASGVIQSAGSIKGDLVITGTSGVFVASAMTFASLRIVTLTSAATLTGCLLSGCGLITAAGASLLNCAIVASTNTPALLWDIATDTSGKLNGTEFTSAGTGHAIELGPNTPDEITLAGVLFTGYGGTPGSNPTENSGSTDAAILNNSGKEITINITNAGTTPAVRNLGTGSTTVIVAGQVTLTLTGLTAGSEVRIYDAGTTDELAGIESSGTTFGYTYTFASQSVDIVVLHLTKLYFRLEDFALASTDASLPIAQQNDRQYENP